MNKDSRYEIQRALNAMMRQSIRQCMEQAADQTFATPEFEKRMTDLALQMGWGKRERIPLARAFGQTRNDFVNAATEMTEQMVTILLANALAGIDPEETDDGKPVSEAHPTVQ